MNLSHFTDEPLVTVRSVEQGGISARGDKPKGLWVSVDGEDDWPSWCRSESFRDIDSQTRYRVTLAESHGVLTLSSVADIDAFTASYADEAERRSYWGGVRSIDWSRVARRWRGIIIAPYQWDRRLDGGADWYYGWDCASGCIWDAAAIESVEMCLPSFAGGEHR